MNPAADRPEFSGSQKIYALLLRAYPRKHRMEYGVAMAQLFHDQCRDAWAEAGGWGMTKLWLRVLPDLVNTSITERLAALKERKTMNDNLANLNQVRPTSATTTFSTIFVTVFLITVIIATAITFIVPETYASTCKLKVENEQPATNNYSYDPYFIQTTFEIINSRLVLNDVVAKLNLNVEWGKKYFNGETLKTTECVEILKGRMALSPVRNTKLIAITVYSDDKNEAALIANAVAEAYKDYRIKSRADLAAKGLEVLEQEYLSESNQIAGMSEYAKFSIAQKDKLEEVLHAHELLDAKSDRNLEQEIFQRHADQDHGGDGNPQRPHGARAGEKHQAHRHHGLQR